MLKISTSFRYRLELIVRTKQYDDTRLVQDCRALITNAIYLKIYQMAYSIYQILS